VLENDALLEDSKVPDKVRLPELIDVAIKVLPTTVPV
jgi:hypothetical protein